MAEEKKAQYSKPASQVDLEARLKNGNRSDKVLSTSDAFVPPEGDRGGRSFAVEGNELDNFVGVSAEYANYANETDKPLVGKAPEDKVITEFAKSQEELTQVSRPAKKTAKAPAPRQNG